MEEIDAKQGRSKRLIVVFGVGWTVFSSVLVAVGLWMAWKAIVVGGWDRVPCEIERFEIAADVSADPPFRPDLVFRYEVDGRKHVGTKLWPEKEGVDDYEDLAELREEILRTMPDCRVNPENPDESFLTGSGVGGIAGGLGFAAFGGLFVLIGLALVKGGLGASGRVEAKSESNQVSPAITLVFFLLFGVAGLAVAGLLVVPKTLDWWAMRGWEEADGEIIWSRVKSKRDDDGTTYAVDLFYRYPANGREHRSNRYDVIGGSSSGSKGKREVVKAYPRGSSVKVYFDPEKPWRAVVKRDVGWEGLFLLFPLPFIAVGAGGIVWYCRKRHEGKPGTGPRSGRLSPGRAPSPRLVGGKWSRMGQSRVGAFVVILIFALFWNGGVSFGVRDAWSGLESGSGALIGRIFSGGMALFMVPFVLVGAVLLLLAVYQLVAVFGPRYEVMIASEGLRPGRSVAVKWRRAGGAGQPRDFALFLVGKEEANGAGESRKRTGVSVFHEEVLFETAVPLAMASGRAELRLPADAVPTFHAKHHRIRWFLCLRAAVPRLPDLSDELEITVHPFRKEDLP